MEGEETVCVTGAGGYIGSWLVMRLLERGYTVRATVLDPNDMNEVKHLLELPKAETHLSLWKADLAVEGSFDEAIHGCSGVFHLATVMNFGSKDPENEVIKPTVEGMISIMKSCTKGKVKKLVFTSSAAAVDIQPLKKQVYDETCWSDTDYIRTTKMTAWTYFLSKTLAEEAAWKYAQEKNLNLITIMPTVVVGPFLIPSMPPSFTTSLSLLTGNEGHYSILKDGHFIHLDDLCMAHIFLYEHPEAKGRYICNCVDETIHTLAKLLNQKYPDYNIPTQFEGVDEEVKVRFSSEKLREIGFEFKYNLEDMFVGAIDSCRHKGLLPLSTPINNTSNPTQANLINLGTHNM